MAKSKCIRCDAAFEFEWPTTRQRFCSRDCLLADWRDLHRKEINEYSRHRRETAPEIRSAIGRKYHASEKGQQHSKAFRESTKAQRAKKCSKRYETDPQYKALLKSRQAAHKMLKAEKNIPYECVSCGSDKGLHAHHKNFDPFKNELSNLEWRCHKCHMGVHYELRWGSSTPNNSDANCS